MPESLHLFAEHPELFSLISDIDGFLQTVIIPIGLYFRSCSEQQQCFLLGNQLCPPIKQLAFEPSTYPEIEQAQQIVQHVAECLSSLPLSTVAMMAEKHRQLGTENHTL